MISKNMYSSKSSCTGRHRPPWVTPPARSAAPRTALLPLVLPLICYFLTGLHPETWAQTIDPGGSIALRYDGHLQTTNHKIPGTFKAEDYADMSGIKTEPTSDQSGGDNIGYIESGDWVEYKVEVASSGKYQVDFRVASQTKGGNITLKTVSPGNESTTLGSVTVKNTGGWQQWRTISTIVSLTQGIHTYRLEFTGGKGYLLNVNRISFAAVINDQKFPTYTTAFSPIHDAYLQDGISFNNEELRVRVDTPTIYLMFDLSSVSGNITSAKLQLTVGSDPGYGTIKVSLGKGTDWTEDNLSTANAPTPVAILDSLDTDFLLDSTFTWNLSNVSVPTGGKLSLIVTHPSGNDVAFMSKENSNTSGRPTLILKTDSDEDGNVAFNTKNASVYCYPNPFRSMVVVNFPSYDQPATLILQGLSGRIVHRQQIPQGQASVRLLLNDALEDILPGLYVLKIVSGNHSQTVKLLKE